MIYCGKKSIGSRVNDFDICIDTSGYWPRIVWDDPGEYVIRLFVEIDRKIGFCVLFGSRKELHSGPVKTNDLINDFYQNKRRFISIKNAFIGFGRKKLKIYRVLEGRIYFDGRGYAKSEIGTLIFREEHCCFMVYFNGNPVKRVVFRG